MAVAVLISRLSFEVELSRTGRNGALACTSADSPACLRHVDGRTRPNSLCSPTVPGEFEKSLEARESAFNSSSLHFSSYSTPDQNRVAVSAMFVPFRSLRSQMFDMLDQMDRADRFFHDPCLLTTDGEQPQGIQNKPGNKEAPESKQDDTSTLEVVKGDEKGQEMATAKREDPWAWLHQSYRAPMDVAESRMASPSAWMCLASSPRSARWRSRTAC